MGAVSDIAWTDSSFNGWIGCSEAGPGCDFCYARDLDARYQWGIPGAEKRTDGLAPHWGPGAPRYRTSVGNWRGPILWNKQAQTLGVPRKVFAHSLSDVFDNEVPEEWRVDLFAMMKETPWLRWQVLTKRVPNIRKMLPSDWGSGYPNVGLVASVVNQSEWDRDVPRLLDIPARWHGFSLEPQLESITMISLLRPYIREARSIWVVTGGESKQKGALGARSAPIEPRDSVPYDPGWARRLINEASIMPTVKVFVKQMGEKPVGLAPPTDGAGDDPELWPEDIRVRDFVPELLS